MLGVITVLVFVIWRLERRQSEHDTEIKNIKENVDKIVNYDSIVSGIERKMLDSLQGIRQELRTVKTLQHGKNETIHKHNNVLEQRFRDVDVGDRPDF